MLYLLQPISLMQDTDNGGPSSRELQRSQRRKPLNTLRYRDFMSRIDPISDDPYSELAYDRFTKGVAVLLADNPHILPDLEAAHRPDRVTMAIIPKLNIVLARYNDEAIAVLPTLSCTINAIYHAFGDKEPEGYRIFSYPGGFPEELERFIASYDPTSRSFNFDHDNPLMYIAADIQGFITSNYYYGENLDRALSPRVSLPVPDGVTALRRGH